MGKDRITGCEALMRSLVNEGVDTVFGYPGGSIMPVFDAMYDYRDVFRSVLVRHEQGAVHAAQGYARSSGKVGLCIVTSGPGATNLITGIANAYMDSVPTIFITGQVNSYEQKGALQVRQRGFQETDIVSMVKSITKLAVQINSTKDLQYYLDYAFELANTGRKGPVLLDIPMNVFRAEINELEMNSYVDEDKIEKNISNKDIEILREKISFAKRQVLLLGNGVKIADQVQKVRELIELIGIPSVSTMLGVDIAGDNTLNYGKRGKK
jgi:acetolactate synthase-1/2/3 large subunit